MSNVEFNIGNKIYNIACDAGEEQHIKKLAKNLNVRVNAISKTFGSASDSLIIAITALMMEDEIGSLKDGKNIANDSICSLTDDAQKEDQTNQSIINALEPITKYVETLANKIENS